MKDISIRELPRRTGAWVRSARKHGRVPRRTAIVRKRIAVSTIVLAITSFAGCSSDSGTNATFVPVKPVPPGGGTRTGGELSIGQGRFFSYAMPPGWRVGEDGQFALTLAAPDNRAVTVMVGNAGLPPQYPPGQYAYDKMMALQPQDLKVGQPRQAPPVAGFRGAYVFDVSYTARGIPSRGLVKVSIAPAYDTATMAMTAALTAADQWAGYSTWLPQVADQISATNGAAFGMRGLMQQNLQNSMAYADAARNYREWSQKNWQQVTNDRNASVDRQQAEFRENLGAVQSYTNPFSTGQAYELPTTHKHYWIDPQGNIVGTDNPTADPNVGSTVEWRRMPQVKR
jgi:hypothetical protein